MPVIVLGLVRVASDPPSFTIQILNLSFHPALSPAPSSPEVDVEVNLELTLVLRIRPWSLTLSLLFLRRNVGPLWTARSLSLSKA